MLEQITWSSYWIAALILLVIYYLVVGLIFFREDIAKGMKRHLVAGRSSGEEQDEEETASGEDGFNELESIVTKIKGTLEEAGKEASKEELLVKLGEILAGYSGLDTPAFRVAINNYIIGHAEKKCAVDFEEEELNQYWQQIRS